MVCRGICIRKYGDRANAQTLCRGNHADGNFASVRYEEFAEHCGAPLHAEHAKACLFNGRIECCTQRQGQNIAGFAGIDDPVIP
jgi:hypothetical protein